MMEYEIICSQSVSSVAREAKEMTEQGWHVVNLSTSFDRGNRENFSILLKRTLSNDGKPDGQ